MAAKKPVRHGRSNASFKSAQIQRSTEKNHFKAKPSRWWHRPIIWVAAFTSALLIAIATALGTGIGDRLFSAVDSDVTASIQPVQIDSVSYVREEGGSVLAFRRNLTKDQVVRLTSSPNVYAFDSIGYNQYLNTVVASGGAVVGSAFVKIVLRGNSQEPVAITGIQAVKECSPTLVGTLLFSPDQGSAPNTLMGFNLDKPSPYAQFWNGQTDKFYGNYFNDKTITLNKGETVTLVADASTNHQYCKFSFLLIVDDGTRTVTEKVMPSRGSFAVTADASTLTGKLPRINFNAYQEMYVGGVASAPSKQYVQVNPQKYKWG